MAAKQKQQPKPTAGKPAAAPKAPQGPRRIAAEPTFRPGFWRAHWMPALLLLLLSFALYGMSIGYGYVLDDQMVASGNAYVQKGFAGLREIFAFDSFMGYFQKKEQLFLLEGGRYRPLSLATFAAEVGVLGKDFAQMAQLRHFLNILLYGLTGILLYRLLLGLFPTRPGGKWYFSLAFLAALFFVLHPLHSECVANIKGRDEILALMGSLAALYAAFKYLDRDNALWLLLSGLFLLLGMLAKESAMTFVAIIPLTLWFFAPQASSGRLFSVTWPLLGAALVFILIRYKALGFMLDHGKAIEDVMNDPFIGMTLGERTATISLTLAWYLKLLFVPHPLTHDYYPYHVPKVGWTDWRALLGIALHLGMGVWAIMNLKKRHLLAYLVLFYLLSLSIVSNLFVSVGTFMNERFVYAPSVAFCVLAAWFFARKLPEWIGEQPDRPSILPAMIAAVLVSLFALRTYTRIPDWKDAFSLNESAVRNSEGSARAQSFYATALYQEKYEKEKDKAVKLQLVEQMEHHVQRALQINPQYSSALTMQAIVAIARFEQDKQMDRLFNSWTDCLEKAPALSLMRDNIERYLEYLAKNGGNPHKISGFTHRIGYELYFKKLKRLSDAAQYLEYGLLNQTEDPRILEALAEVYDAAKKPDKAAEMRARANANR
jgi:hypothetical protein